jgi:hypothetical protein
MARSITGRNCKAFALSHSIGTDFSGLPDWSRQTLGPYRDCPERRSVGVRGRVVGAVSIGSFELSRWRLRRTRWAMGFQSVGAGCRASLKQATETKGEPALFLNIALES